MAAGTLGGSTLGASAAQPAAMAATTTQPAATQRRQWGQGFSQPAAATTPASPGATMYTGEAAKGQNFGQNQMIGVQGTGVDPTNPTQTGGFQYSLANQPGAIQNSIDNPAVDASKIAAAQMPVSSVGTGDVYQSQMQDAYMNQAKARLDPMWQDRQKDLEGQLANMGLTRGTQAWNREMQNMMMGRNDAYGQAMNQAILTSGQEAQRMQGMNLASGNFANQAAQQNFANQGLSQQWQNAATGQQFQQGLAQGQFANAAQNQGFTQDMGMAGLNNAALQAQQQAAQGWGAQATQRYGADQSKAGQIGSAQASASGMVGAANASANASMANAQLNAALQARQIGNAEQQQAYSNARQSTFDPYLLSNLASQGMYPTSSPTYQNPGQMSPTTQNSSGYVSGLTNAQNQQGQGTSNILGSLAGFLPF